MKRKQIREWPKCVCFKYSRKIIESLSRLQLVLWLCAVCICLYWANTRLLTKCNPFRVYFDASTQLTYIFCLLCLLASFCLLLYFSMAMWMKIWKTRLKIALKPNTGDSSMAYYIFVCFSILRSVYAFNCFNKLNFRLKTNVNNKCSKSLSLQFHVRHTSYIQIHIHMCT